MAVTGIAGNNSPRHVLISALSLRTFRHAEGTACLELVVTHPCHRQLALLFWRMREFRPPWSDARLLVGGPPCPGELLHAF